MKTKQRTYANCKHCGEHKMVIGRGWCGACYSRFQVHGSPEFRPRKDRAVCTVDGCEKSVVSHGLCDSHRKMQERYGRLETVRPKDWGKKTKHPLYVYWVDTRRRESLNICEDWNQDFWKFAECVGDRPSKSHFLRAVDVTRILSPDNWQWVEGLDKAARINDKRRRSRDHDRNRALVSRQERQALIVAAEGMCQICGKKDSGDRCGVTGEAKIKTLCVDHDHKTGALRGILCRACNSGIGYLKDDVRLLENAIRYLTEAKASNQNSVPVG